MVMRHPSYLQRDRHGTWYFRARTPVHIRRAQPALPAEVRVSTGTKSGRVARVFGHLLYRNWVDWSTGFLDPVPAMADTRGVTGAIAIGRYWCNCSRPLLGPSCALGIAQ